VESKKVKSLSGSRTESRFLTNLLIKITGKHPCAGRKKIRGAVVAFGLAVRIFPALRDKKYKKTNSYAEQKQGIASNLDCPNPPSKIIVSLLLWKLLNALFHSLWQRTAKHFKLVFFCSL
jgi:hypothetical protein